MNNLEKILSKYFKKKYCLLTGSGTTGMYLVFKSFKKKSKILYPAITCIQAVNAAIFAGHQVIFSDVNKDNYVMDLNCLKKSITKDTLAVVPTHTFGNICEIKKIIQHCKRKGIFVFEDATQAMGAKIGEKKIGSFGDASVISFGYSKILDCGSGGCILTNNKTLYKNLKKNYAKIKLKPKNYKKIFKQYKKTYYDLRYKIKNNKIFSKKILKIQSKYKEIFIYKIDKFTIKKITRKLKELKYIIKKRNLNHNLYKKYLKNIVPTKNNKNFVSWRFTGLINTRNKNIVIKKLRENNIDVSTWYTSMHYINDDNKIKYKNAIKIEKKIINFWTEPTINKETIMNNIKVINNYL